MKNACKRSESVRQVDTFENAIIMVDTFGWFWNNIGYKKES